MMDSVKSGSRTYGGLTAEERAQGRRQRFVQAARELIGEIGVAALTVDLVCQRSGVSKRYFYEEFSGKDDVLDACADDLYTRLREGFTAEMAAVPPGERVNAVLRSVIYALASDPADARLYRESPGFPRLHRRQQQAVQEFTTVLATQAMPFTGPPAAAVDRQLATRALVAGTADVITAWLNGDVETDVETLIATLNTTALAAAERL